MGKIPRSSDSNRSGKFWWKVPGRLWGAMDCGITDQDGIQEDRCYFCSSVQVVEKLARTRPQQAGRLVPNFSIILRVAIEVVFFLSNTVPWCASKTLPETYSSALGVMGVCSDDGPI
eukprot:s126_g23.t1